MWGLIINRCWGQKRQILNLYDLQTSNQLELMLPSFHCNTSLNKLKKMHICAPIWCLDMNQKWGWVNFSQNLYRIVFLLHLWKKVWPKPDMNDFFAWKFTGNSPSSSSSSGVTHHCPVQTDNWVSSRHIFFRNNLVVDLQVWYRYEAQ